MVIGRDFASSDQGKVKEKLKVRSDSRKPPRTGCAWLRNFENSSTGRIFKVYLASRRDAAGLFI